MHLQLCRRAAAVLPDFEDLACTASPHERERRGRKARRAVPCITYSNLSMRDFLFRLCSVRASQMRRAAANAHRDAPGRRCRRQVCRPQPAWSSARTRTCRWPEGGAGNQPQKQTAHAARRAASAHLQRIDVHVDVQRHVGLPLVATTPNARHCGASMAQTAALRCPNRQRGACLCRTSCRPDPPR